MTLLQWKSEYSTGIAAVDYEHQQLIELINRLHDQLEASDAATTVPGFFGYLLRGISAHFALEERLMRESAYERLPPHKEDHERLLGDLRELMDTYENSEEVDVVDLSGRLDAWFSHHFRTYDAELHKAVGAHA